MSLLRANELLHQASALLAEADLRLKLMRDHLAISQGYLPYNQNNLYKDINASKAECRTVQDKIFDVKEEIDSYLSSFSKDRYGL
jgi:hypothetical protein